MVYLGSDKERQTSTWDETKPKFYVEDGNLQYTAEGEGANAIKQVRSKFSKRHIYYVGSHEGCGCGFRQEWFWTQDNKEEIDKTDENQKYLYEYVFNCLKDENTIEIYACWAGSEKDPAKSKREIAVQEIFKNDFFFKEDEFIVVENKLKLD